MRLIFAIFTFIYLIQTVASFLIQKWTSTPFTTTLFDHDVQDHDDYRNLIQQNLPPTQGFDDNDDDKKLAWARHTIMSIAANVMGIPSDVFTTPPMIDPRPPKTLVEKSVRQKINVSMSSYCPLEPQQCHEQISYFAFILQIINNRPYSMKVTQIL